MTNSLHLQVTHLNRKGSSCVLYYSYIYIYKIHRNTYIYIYTFIIHKQQNFAFQSNALITRQRKEDEEQFLQRQAAGKILSRTQFQCCNSTKTTRSIFPCEMFHCLFTTYYPKSPCCGVIVRFKKQVAELLELGCLHLPSRPQFSE